MSQNCGRCHACGGLLRQVLDGEEWCEACHRYRRYRSHGWAVTKRSMQDELDAECPAGEPDALADDCMLALLLSEGPDPPCDSDPADERPGVGR